MKYFPYCPWSDRFEKPASDGNSYEISVARRNDNNLAAEKYIRILGVNFVWPGSLVNYARMEGGYTVLDPSLERKEPVTRRFPEADTTIGNNNGISRRYWGYADTIALTYATRQRLEKYRRKYYF